MFDQDVAVDGGYFAIYNKESNFERCHSVKIPRAVILEGA